MGKGRPRAVEKGVLGQTSSVLSSESLNIPPAPVYYPTEDEFRDPLEYICKIRPEAEPYGICRIVPPKCWKPPFALDLDSFTFPTKTQAIHQLQARPPACDSKTFELEYNRFLEDHCGRKFKKKVVFEGKELDLCKLFNGVKRYGGYDKVVEDKKWGEVFRFLNLGTKISECSKHVLCQLYREHLYDYENYYNRVNRETGRVCKRGMQGNNKSGQRTEYMSCKRRRRNKEGERVQVRKEEKVEELDQICEQCRSGLHGEVMLLCDRCNKGWHIYCLSPPLKRVPPGNWYCMACLNSDKDSFGFVPGKCFSMEAFRRFADRAKKKWFGSASVSRVQMEKFFWEIVEGSVGEVEVMYGSDLDTSVYGSGFPRINNQRLQSIEAELWDEYCGSPWNLNNLPKLQGSMLQAVRHNIAGVMVPWLYVGMLFSAFCWHFEDHCFYSMNYLHWGEPKCWYSVPGSEAKAFEKVMRKCLPDLFDAQPDLLFQLVTMLNPSVLQDHGVPVYSVLQEPGNFVITFPRSFHGGFNFGLNCAEAVNFAPADWLPHGGSGAELYRSYHKAAVLSHEELLCTVAKSNCDRKVSPYLKKELLRIYAMEKSCRERLWKVGVVKSSPMSPRKHPEYVGTEEDPTCIICQQYLYLSAVVCRCRPSAFVCLQHWEHLCECKHSKQRLLYRYTLAELNDLVLMTDEYNCEETPQNRISRRQVPSCDETSGLMKKVKGGHVTFAQLAEEWLLRYCKILQTPYSSNAYTNALKESEQFLWAGSEMDPVRDVVKNLIEAQNWAEKIKECLSKVEKWSSHGCNDANKVCLEHVNNLLYCNPVPCNEPGHLRLTNYAEEARVLTREIDSALSTCSKVSITELDALYSRARDLPIYLEEIEKLKHQISSAKVLIKSVRKCISEKCPAAIEVDFLYKLKSEILELQVQVPETEILLELLGQAESCRVHCSEFLTGPINLKNVELFLEKLDSFTINIPELKLLRQYRSDAISWICRFNGVLVNIHEREDQENVVNELKSILKDGALLRIQVGELPLVEVELEKACCREKAQKAHSVKVSVEFIEQVMMEAVGLQIEREKLFVDLSGVLAAAIHWEERARHVLENKSHMSEFEDVLRTAEHIHAILPSLDDIKDAMSMAKSWLRNSELFLATASNAAPACSSSLEVEALEALLSQAEGLKMVMEERMVLQTILNNCKEFERDACALLHDAEYLSNMNDIGNEIRNGLTLRIESLVTSLKSVIKVGLSLNFVFNEIPKLQEAYSSLQWCNKTLSFCSVSPSCEEVQNLIKLAQQLPVAWVSCALCSSLIDGVGWLEKAASLVPASGSRNRYKQSDAENILSQYQRLRVSFPVMVDQVVNAIDRHKLWRQKVKVFFSLNLRERCWSQLLQLRELGKGDAFSCSELDRVQSEVEKVEKWKRRCEDIVGPSAGDSNPYGALSEIRHTLERSLYIYDKSRGCKVRDLCMWCSGGFEGGEFLTCSVCNECYHLKCLGQKQADKLSYMCPYCQFLESGSVSWNGACHLRSKGKRPELKMLLDLLSDSQDFIAWIDEIDLLQEVVEQALACKTFLTEAVDYVLAHRDKNLSVITEKLTVALKAAKVASVFDSQSNIKLESALVMNAWRVRSNKLLESSQKPLIQQIQRHLKEGLAIGIMPEDHYWQKLTELKCIGLQWADTAKKVAADSGALELDKVFELILEGENLPIRFEKELKLLRARSMLYCICRKPYDQRAMIACDQCDEWYHFDCIGLSSAPKTYFCPACKPQTEELSTSLSLDKERSSGAKFGEPQTPSPRHTEPRRRMKKHKLNLKQKMQVATDKTSFLRYPSGIECLLWRNRKPFRRAAKKRAELETLSSLFHKQQQT